MRVFELARELNIPGKELIERIKGMGFTVEGNFNVLDEKIIGEIKERMLEPVTRIEEEAEDSSLEDEEQPRKRRIISARRSAEVHRIQESLGETGPLPEDEKTREEVKPPSRTEEKGDGEMEVESVTSAEPPPEPIEVATASTKGAVAAATPEKSAPAPEIPPPTAPAEAVPAPEGKVLIGKEPASEVVPPKREKDFERLKEMGSAAPGAAGKKGPEGERGRWKEFKRGDRKQAPVRGDKEDGWVRAAKKRGGDKRGRRGGRKAPKHTGDQKHVFGPRKKAIRLGQTVSISELAGALGVKVQEILRKLMDLGMMVNLNDPIEGSTAELIASEFNIEVEVDTTNLEDIIKEEEIDPSNLESRPIIVTIMGHVDHGKTSLLDFIRHSKITSGEAGGITQHIGAYHIKTEEGDIVFLDTPGHEAFTSLRARGADITDLVVLVVAADDGVMPQTLEAIDHARAAKVPIMVALNKMDRQGADPEKIKRQLMENDILTEEFGGETVLVPVSAKTGEGVDQLLEMIHLQAEMMELKTTYQSKARGFVIESRMDRQRGPLASVIVQRGTLRVGDDFVAGATFGRVRAMFDDQGSGIEETTPSLPVEILGYNDMPRAGDVFVVVEDEKTARQIAEGRASKVHKEEGAEKRRMHLEDFIQSGSREEADILTLVLKADTQGSLEALQASLGKQGNENARVEIIRAGLGGISETDISLASTTGSVVIGFNVRSDNKAGELARSEGVDVKVYTIIYDLINDVRDALQGLLKPIIREDIIGHCEVRDVFSVSKEGQIAGGYITDGRLERNSNIRLYRDNIVIHSGLLGSLRRFKDDVQNVQSGYECGFRIANFTDVRVGDLIEAYVNVEEAQILDKAGGR